MKGMMKIPECVLQKRMLKQSAQHALPFVDFHPVWSILDRCPSPEMLLGCHGSIKTPSACNGKKRPAVIVELSAFDSKICEMYHPEMPLSCKQMQGSSANKSQF